MRLTHAQAQALGIDSASGPRQKRNPSGSPKATPGPFAALCTAAGLPRPVPEYIFCPGRRWRFDWCFVAEKLAIEQQGGLFVQGRHVRGAALLNEYAKLSQAAILGFRILFVTPQQFASGEALKLVEQALKESQCPHKST